MIVIYTHTYNIDNIGQLNSLFLSTFVCLPTIMKCKLIDSSSAVGQ